MQGQIDRFLDRYRASPLPRQTVPVPNYEDKKAQFREFYASQYRNLRAAEEMLRNLTQLLLRDLPIEERKLDSRVKDRDECLKKFEIKYRDEIERKDEDYEIRHFITDIIGIRIICLYEPDISLVKDRLRQQFNVLGLTDKTSILTEDVSSFGYKGIHLDLKIKEDRAVFLEYKSFADFQFEIQIRTIVQHSWSEIDHRLKYKKQIPDILKRRIIRLAALFELADQEFESVRNETIRLQEIASHIRPPDNAVGVRDEKLDVFSFLSIMQSRYPGYTFDPIKVDGFVDEINSMKKDFSVKEFQEALENHSQIVNDYRRHKTADGFSFNPYTEIRHVLYMSSPTIFDRILYPMQRNRFLDWLNEASDSYAA